MIYFSINLLNMKRIISGLLALTLFFGATAQSGKDTSVQAMAVAVCDCLTKADITDNTSQQQIQQAFMSCIFSSAPDLVSKIASGGGDAEAAQQMATNLAMEMLKNGCPAFAKIAGAMAMDGGSEFEMTMPSQVQTVKTESAEGTITKVEERDFTYLTLKTAAGRELTFIYYGYVPGSDEWIKDAVTKLKNKNVYVSYIESEVYQPKYKEFMNVKEIKTLTIK